MGFFFKVTRYYSICLGLLFFGVQCRIGVVISRAYYCRIPEFHFSCIWVPVHKNMYITMSSSTASHAAGGSTLTRLQESIPCTSRVTCTCTAGHRIIEFATTRQASHLDILKLLPLVASLWIVSYCCCRHRLGRGSRVCGLNHIIREVAAAWTGQ